MLKIVTNAGTQNETVEYVAFMGGDDNTVTITERPYRDDKMLVVRMNPNVKLPERGQGNAGYDLFCPERMVCKAGQITKIGSGLQIRPPINQNCMVVAWDKSSIAAGNNKFKGYLTVIAGLFDQSYQGEYIIALLNESDEDIVLEAGQKFVQLVVLPILTPEIVVVESVQDFGTDTLGRLDGGFGSTGDGITP